MNQILQDGSPKSGDAENREVRLQDLAIKTPDGEMEIDSSSLSNPKIYSENIKAETSPLSGAMLSHNLSPENLGCLYDRDMPDHTNPDTPFFKVCKDKAFNISAMLDMNQGSLNG